MFFMMVIVKCTAIIPVLGYYCSTLANEVMTGFMAVNLTDGQSLQLLQGLSQKGKPIFTLEEAAEVARLQNIQLPQLRKMLSRLSQAGWLIRLRRGLYAGMGSLPNQAHINEFAIATRLVEPSAISHWSAMQHHGLTEQIPQQVITATTIHKITTPSMRQKKIQHSKYKHAWEIGGIRYEYITIKPQRFFGIEKVWVDQYFRVPVTDKERTLLDGFAYSKIFGGMGGILGILEEALPTIDIKKLVNYAIQYDKLSVIKRLGWALEYFDISEKYLLPLLKIPVGYYSRLDPSKLAVGHCDKRWMIQNNMGVKEK
jgi:predicted transcriptional regulator of viral defense system